MVYRTIKFKEIVVFMIIPEIKIMIFLNLVLQQVLRETPSLCRGNDFYGAWDGPPCHVANHAVALGRDWLEEIFNGHSRHSLCSLCSSFLCV